MNIESIVSEFAKANKASKAKLMSLVEQCIDVHIQSVPKASNACVGRKASSETLELRDKIRNMAPELSKSQFTIKQIAQMLKAEHVAVGNTVNKLAQEGMFVKKGYVKEGSGKGRPSVVWGVV